MLHACVSTTEDELEIPFYQKKKKATTVNAVPINIIAYRACHLNANKRMTKSSPTQYLFLVLILFPEKRSTLDLVSPQQPIGQFK